MTRDQAHREAKKRWGAKAALSVGSAVSSPENRERAAEEFRAAAAKYEAVKAEIDARLKALDWYQALLVERRAAYDQKERASGQRFYKKFNVGSQNNLWREIIGSGDTWEEAFAEADKRRQKSA